MAQVEIRGSSQWWYGRQMIRGHRRLINTGVLIKGQRPTEDDPDGDEVFRASRTEAVNEVERIRARSLQKAQTEDILQAIHEARTGRKVGSVLIGQIFAKWKALPRRRALAPAYVAWAEGVFKRFAEFLSGLTPACQEMSDVATETAIAFLDAEQARGITPHTWNSILSLLKSAFAHLRKAAGMPDNPFDDIPTKVEDPIHRRPFSPDDLKLLLDAARGDSFMCPLIVTGMCTAMRRGDVCRLRWADVDLKNRFITVKTAKTGARVSIPMFPMLYDELHSQPRLSPFVFPEAEETYRKRPDTLNRRFMQFFRTAGYYNPDQNTAHLALPTQTLPGDWKDSATAKLRAAPLSEKRKALLLQVLGLYAAGVVIPRIAEQLAMSKGSVSYNLHHLEQLAGHAIVRRASKDKPAAPHREDMHLKAEGARRSVSVRGFHSFRTTWVTLALTAGVPIDLVRKVTGHRTADIVFANYFQPGREQFRQVLHEKMPNLLTSGSKTPQERAVEILRAATADTWQSDIERAIAVLTAAEHAVIV